MGKLNMIIGRGEREETVHGGGRRRKYVEKMNGHGWVSSLGVRMDREREMEGGAAGSH